jgi:hypothetical protein
MKSLIISPQAGFANRLRALCSAKIIGDMLGRKVYHYWVEDEIKSGLEHVNQMKSISMESIFDSDIPRWNGGEVDMCFSEWVEFDGWYTEQSTAIRKLRPKTIKKFTSIDEVLKCDDDVILIETTIELSLNISIWEDLMHKTYQQSFKLIDEWQKVYDNLPEFDCGISIRRGDFFHFYPESIQSIEYVVESINSLKGSKFITGDDSQFISEVRRKTNSVIQLSDFDRSIEFTIAHFLMLSKCKHTYGTKNSSYVKQASIYGGNKNQEL